MKKLLSALFLLALCSSLATATVPDPSKCSVTPDFNDGVLIAPGTLNGTTMSITVRNISNNPIPNASVQVVFDPDIAECSTAQHSAQTLGDGTCQIDLRGGGCINSATVGACAVIANGIEIKNFLYVKSPDNGAHLTSQPSGSVNTVDLPFFADEFKGVAPGDCHDYNNDDVCNTVDLPTFGDAFKLALVCPLP